MLEREEDRICRAWTERLSDPAGLASQRLNKRATSLPRLLLQDVVRILRGELPVSHVGQETLALAGGEPFQWQINQTHALEVFLTGEVVVRAWALGYLDATEREQLEIFEDINRAFHELLRLHMRRYCDECRCAHPPTD
ncbi:MAG: hypothetical protein N3A53_02630 [Verrucomicrobiae bacterium]|nr:hypothetical protein [Verrucomicrobiae bacterium]